MRGVLATALAVAAGTAAVWYGTNGLLAFTTEGARRLAVARAPRALPDVGLEDQDGHPFALTDLRGRVVLVDFIYTSCPSVCVRLGETFRAVHARLLPGVALVSISFDLEHDTPERLAGYGRLHGADGRLWRIARPASAEGAAELLRAFGVKVIPDGRGGFVHNAAVHLVDARGRLAAILDYDDPQGVLERVTTAR